MESQHVTGPAEPAGDAASADGAESTAAPTNRAQDLVDTLVGYRVPTRSESDCQATLATILERSGVTAVREYDLGAFGRIDFYLSGMRLGLEVKVKGSPVDVLRQLLRYSESPEIDALILVTARAALGGIPPTLGGKPVYIASLWRGLL